MRGKWSESRITRMIREGRGKGEGSEYRPWLQAQEVSSLGVATRHFCLKTGRQHEYLSEVEYSFHLMLAWNPDVIDIREQYPLSREITRRIAAELGIKHPCYPSTHVETVMTVDFLVTRIRDGEQVYEAYDTKCAEDLENPRTLEKLEIVQASFAEANIPHHIVCADSLPRRKVGHLLWVQKGMVMPGEPEPVPGFYDDYCARMLCDLPRAPKTLRLNDYCGDFDKRYALPDGTGLRLARILMGRRDLLPDFDQPELENAALGTFIASQSQPLRMAAGAVA